MKRIVDLFNDLAEKVGMILLVIMLLVVSMQVFTRLIIKTSPRWAEEVATILMVWFGFLGMSIGVKEGIHISIGFFIDSMTPKIRRAILIIDELLIIFFGCSLVWYGGRLIYETRGSTLPATQWSACTPYLMLPVTGALIVLYCIIKVWDIIQNKEDESLEV